MQITSEKGIAFLRYNEATVLKAYRDPVGIITIGDGLTAASGVIKPKLGMTITAAEADRLLRLALARNYEPRVRSALGKVPQQAFDGGISFDWNTGAIHKASWVTSYMAGRFEEVRSKLALWKNGGGKVLPGLVRRRKEEADIILENVWPKAVDSRLPIAAGTPAPDPKTYASFVVAVTSADIQSIRDGFRAVGFEPGTKVGAVLRAAVEGFQQEYDLTVDGKVGKATLSTLQRELDARSKSAKSILTGVGSGALAGGNEVVTPDTTGLTDLVLDPATLTLALCLVALAAAGYLAYLGWHYRDIIAPRLQYRFPKFAAWLRSF